MSSSLSHLQSTEQSSKQHVCLSSFRAVVAYATLPQTSINTLWKDFDDEFSAKYEAAIQQLVEQNPVLSGTLSLTWSGSVHITKGVFQPKNHSFCSFFELPRSHATDYYHKSPREMTAKEKLEIMVLITEESFPAHRWSITDAWKKCPLFEVHIMKLQDNFAVTSFRINHFVGDASTRVLLENQLQQLLLSEEITPINWNNDERLIIPMDYDSSSYSWRELIITYLGELTLYKRFLSVSVVWKFTGSILLSKKKIEDMKSTLKRTDVPFLTSNDIIVAALAQQESKSYGCISVTKNYRGQKTASSTLKNRTIAEYNDAGNFLRPFYLLQDDARDPNKCHSLARAAGPLKTGTLPSWEMLTHTELLTTSIRNLGEKLNDRCVCRAASQGFPSLALWRFVVINDFDDDHVCLVHNDRLDTDGKGLLRQLVA